MSAKCYTLGDVEGCVLPCKLVEMIVYGGPLHEVVWTSSQESADTAVTCLWTVDESDSPDVKGTETQAQLSANYSIRVVMDSPHHGDVLKSGCSSSCICRQLLIFSFIITASRGHNNIMPSYITSIGDYLFSSLSQDTRDCIYICECALSHVANENDHGKTTGNKTTQCQCNFAQGKGWSAGTPSQYLGVESLNFKKIF